MLETFDPSFDQTIRIIGVGKERHQIVSKDLLAFAESFSPGYFLGFCSLKRFLGRTGFTFHDLGVIKDPNIAGFDPIELTGLGLPGDLLLGFLGGGSLYDCLLDHPGITASDDDELRHFLNSQLATVMASWASFARAM